MREIHVYHLSGECVGVVCLYGVCGVCGICVVTAGYVCGLCLVCGIYVISVYCIHVVWEYV